VHLFLKSGLTFANHLNMKLHFFKQPLLVCLFSVAAGTYIADAEDLTPGHFYYIQSKVSGLDLDVNGGNSTNGGSVVQAPQNIPQSWEFLPDGDGYFHVRSNVSGMYLDVGGGSHNVGSSVDQAVRDPDQSWKLIPDGNGYYHIQSKVSNLFLDVDGGRKDVGAPIDQATPNSDQVWKLIPVSFVTTMRPGGGNRVIQFITGDGRYADATAEAVNWTIAWSTDPDWYIWKRKTESLSFTNAADGSSWTCKIHTQSGFPYGGRQFHLVFSFTDHAGNDHDDSGFQFFDWNHQKWTVNFDRPNQTIGGGSYQPTFSLQRN
jgi:hypothetical protein